MCIIRVFQYQLLYNVQNLPEKLLGDEIFHAKNVVTEHRPLAEIKLCLNIFQVMVQKWTNLHFVAKFLSVFHRSQNSSLLKHISPYHAYKTQAIL
jgi:hypothetical protein